MRTVLPVVLVLAGANAQTPIGGKPIDTPFKNIKPGDLTPKLPHHLPMATCKGKPDHVYAKRKGTYFACLNGKDVCTAEKGVAIPQQLIAAFDAYLREREAWKKQIHDKLDAAFRDRPGEAAGQRAPVIQIPSGTAASPPPPPAVADELLEGISAGSPRADVIQRLGEPHMKIAGGGEYYTYNLKSGGTAELDFAEGKLVKLRVVPQR